MRGMTKTEQLQAIADEFFQENGGGKATSRTIARWAIDKGLWRMPAIDGVKMCAEELSHAMREQFITDRQGRKVRVKLALRLTIDGEQLAFWGDMRYAPREDVEFSCQQRRQQIVQDCLQLRNDVDSYNENYNQGTAIQLSLDFTNDVLEAQLAGAVLARNKEKTDTQAA